MEITHWKCVLIALMVLCQFAQTQECSGGDCTSPPPTCTSTYVGQKGETCTIVAVRNGLTVEQFQALNPGIDCNETLENITVCLFAQVSPPCTENYTVISGDTCWSIWVANGLTETQFFSMNPGLNCSTLAIGQSVCIGNDAIQRVRCAYTYRVRTNDTCYLLIQRFGLDTAKFYELNPNIDCLLLQINYPLCIAQGPYNPANCSQSFWVRDGDTCQQIASDNGLSLDQLQELNPSLDGSNLNDTDIVCISGMGGLNPASALEKLVALFSPLNPDITTAYNAYLKDPTDATEAAVMNAVYFTIASDDGRSQVIELQKSDAQFAALQDSMSIRRTVECKNLTSTSFTESANCMCATAEQEPYLYCRALFYIEFQRTVDQTLRYSKSIDGGHLWERLHSHFDKAYANTTGIDTRSIGDCLDFSFNADPNACISSSCCASYVLVEMCLYTALCLPAVDMQGASANVKVCQKGACNTFTIPSPGFDAVLETYFTMELSICLDLGFVTDILHALGIDICFARMSFKYYPLKMQLHISFGLSFIGLVSFDVGLTIQTGPSPAKWCTLDAYKCQEFCVAPKGYVSGDTTVSVGLFGLFKTTYDIYHTPKLPCDAGRFSTPRPDPPPYDIIGYYPNWLYYQNDYQVLPIKNSVTKMNYINYAFTMISYDVDNKVWYNDFTDPWGDVGVCGEVSDSMCQLKEPPGIELPNSCYVIDQNTQQPSVSVAPYIGYREPGQCRTASSCYNKGGTPDGRSIPCSMNLYGNARPFWRNEPYPYSYALGQYNYILNDVRKVSKGYTEVGMSIGGWYDSNYFTAATRPENLAAFVRSISEFVATFGFDFVDLDWEYPGWEHGNQPQPGDTSAPLGTSDDMFDCAVTKCKYDRSNDMENFIALLTSLRQNVQLNNAGYPVKLSFTAPAGNDKISKFNISAVCALADSVNIMTYDIHGTWDNITNHQSPLYDATPGLEGGGSGSSAGTSVHSAVTAWINGGCPPEKINIGVPFYGRVYEGVGQPTTTGPGGSTTGGGSTSGGNGGTCSAYYTVLSGDSCWSIADSHGMDLQKFLALNPNLDCDKLQVGQQVCVSGDSGGSGDCAKYYTVVSGDSCWAIANQFGIDVATLQDLNPTLDCDTIYVGQQLCVQSSSSPQCGQYYTVVSGDYCYDIASRFGIDIDILQALNPTLDCNALQVGQQLCVKPATRSTLGGYGYVKAGLPGLYEPFAGAGSGGSPGGTVTMTGILSYKQIKEAGYPIYWDDISKASYAFDGSTFVSFDDEKAVAAKMDYIKTNKLKGAIFWMYGQDDDDDTLLNTMYSSLSKP